MPLFHPAMLFVAMPPRSSDSSRLPIHKFWSPCEWITQSRTVGCSLPRGSHRNSGLESCQAPLLHSPPSSPLPPAPPPYSLLHCPIPDTPVSGTPRSTSQQRPGTRHHLRWVSAANWKPCFFSKGIMNSQGPRFHFVPLLTCQPLALCWERDVRSTSDSPAVTMRLASISSRKTRSHIPFSTMPHQAHNSERPNPCWTAGQRRPEVWCILGTRSEPCAPESVA